MIYYVLYNIIYILGIIILKIYQHINKQLYSNAIYTIQPHNNYIIIGILYYVVPIYFSGMTAVGT